MSDRSDIDRLPGKLDTHRRIPNSMLENVVLLGFVKMLGDFVIRGTGCIALAPWLLGERWILWLVMTFALATPYFLWMAYLSLKWQKRFWHALPVLVAGIVLGNLMTTLWGSALFVKDAYLLLDLLPYVGLLTLAEISTASALMMILAVFKRQRQILRELEAGTGSLNGESTERAKP